MTRSRVTQSISVSPPVLSLEPERQGGVRLGPKGGSPTPRRTGVPGHPQTTRCPCTPYTPAAGTDPKRYSGVVGVRGWGWEGTSGLQEREVLPRAASERSTLWRPRVATEEPVGLGIARPPPGHAGRPPGVDGVRPPASTPRLPSHANTRDVPHGRRRGTHPTAE